VQGNPWTPGIFVPYPRSVGGIVAQVWISEQERDELHITEHPVEQGAPISDHAYKRPSEVIIRCGWSAGWAGDLSDTSGVYGTLLAWQSALQPFDLYTGKRHYRDMLLQGIVVSTDQSSAFVLMAELICKQIIIVSTQTAQLQSYSSDSTQQSDPESTSAQTKNGDQQPKPTTTSGGFNTVRSGTGPTEIPPGENPGAPATGGFSSVRTGTGPTDIPPGDASGSPGNDATVTQSVYLNTTSEQLGDKGFTQPSPMAQSSGF
jgi:hypothetical protein